MKKWTAVIQAGGMGTRLHELTKGEIPKPLYPLLGKPIIQHQLEKLIESGIQRFVFIVGHLGDKIQEYFKDGANWGVYINYIVESEPLGSAGALSYLKERFCTEDFLLIFGDVMFDIDIDRMITFHERKGSNITLLVHPNSHPYDSDLVVLDKEERIIGFDSKKNKRNYWYDNCVNAGIYIFNKGLLEKIEKPKKLDLESDIIVPYLGSGKVYGYRTTEYVKDAGTVERFYAVEKDFQSGTAFEKNLKRQQKCIFLDRDGTLNIHKGFIDNEIDFELEKNAAEAVKLINDSGYLAIVVTNQPVVARGQCSIEDVNNIHKKMASLLGDQGAFLDDIIFCPHHPDKGYPEEKIEYKVVCNCRKPNTGMIDLMVQKYNIDKEKSFIIGDTTSDILTGIKSGLSTVIVQTGEGGRDRKYSVSPDKEAVDILDAVKQIVNNKGGYKL
ncbi:histidinol phosphate phosphatase [Anaerocolumna cellulosilytica]|uniref:Histidinol phosphate phosphatase n=1 Tax=Anaerocolumna cellulosilytica TaxID=433286 RepID=A0A6S6QQU1_9FIRM|nr:HAD-IIIA family hydrolase [Anaerocolumna cellulosilytica]MBB5195700.1 D,D-heptose 1,7-bisphosphate phosphatase [Anaerocolumna cellulosilytica]BCJ92964.1 histidinol phosphate phosphatase [Anaerocolumna cellulosilytica]